MKKHLGKLIILVLVLAVAAYLYLGKERVFKYVMFWDNSNKTTDQLGIKTKNMANAVSDIFSKDSISKTTDKITDKTKDLFSGVVDQVKLGAYNVLKNSIDQKVDNLAKDMGVNAQNANSAAVGSETASTIFFSVKVGVLAYFTMENTENEKLNFNIDWQDGTTGSGSLDQKSTIILSHSWSKAGNYQIKFKMIYQSKEKEYNIPVVVF
ncbi:MAG: hypothetical protein Athens101426_498 [Parcubacteria group bacterium Athens1014_26]|nr:MAG: hypothetical protein Athens101426_498 [Parcubacteria group bacterium Athens1014_26]